MAYSSRELLARIIKCEAEGEGDNGMKAVASVIMNRVNVSGGQYLKTCQGDLRKVILDPGEFTCAMPTVYGKPNPRTIWSSPPDQKHYEIADWALSGHKLWGVGNSLWYYHPYNTPCNYFFPITKTGVYITKVREHCFYNPTAKYYTT